MKHPLVLFSAAAVSSSATFVPPKRTGHGFPCRAAKNNNNEGGQNDIFDMVNNFWEAKKKDVGFPNVKLPSMPNPLDGFLKKGREAATTIEGVEDFDVDLAKEIEAALAMANNEVEKQQPQQPLRNDAANNMNSNRSVESATAAATKAWLDGMTSDNTSFDDMSSSSNGRQSEYSNETTKCEQNNRNLFFATNVADQYTKTESNDDNYFRGSSWSAESDNNVDNERVKWSVESNNDSYNDNFSTATQSFADESIRAGQEKKSVEETYKMYKQYFEQGVDTSFNARRNDVEVPLQNDDSEYTYVPDEEEEDVIVNEDYDGTKVYISDAAFELSRSLNLDPYEIYQHIQNSSDGNVMVEEQDVRNYLDWRYNALLLKTSLPKPKKQQPKRPQRVDQRVDQRTYRGNNGYSLPINDLEMESGDNWQSYYDTYRRMAEPTAPSRGHRASSRQSPNRQRRDESRQVSSVQPRSEPRSFPETNFPQYLTSHLPQRPRESQLSKLIFETKTEKFSNSHMRSATTDAVPFEQVNQANFYPRKRHEDSRREHEFHQKTSRGLGVNKNYPQDRSYRDTKNKNSIDMISRGNDDNMTYEQYNAYFAPQTKRHTPVMPTSSGNSLKGLLENRLDRNLHKQELYNHQQYLDERLQRDMQRVSRLTNVQDQQRALESRLEYNTRQREMQELDQRLEQNIRRLSKTTQRVSRDAQRAIEGVQREWFSNRNEDQNKFGP